jgi:hypothetical protein
MRLGITFDTRNYRYATVNIERRIVGEAFDNDYRNDVGDVDELDNDDESSLKL